MTAVGWLQPVKIPPRRSLCLMPPTNLLRDRVELGKQCQAVHAENLEFFPHLRDARSIEKDARELDLFVSLGNVVDGCLFDPVDGENALLRDDPGIRARWIDGKR